MTDLSMRLFSSFPPGPLFGSHELFQTSGCAEALIIINCFVFSRAADCLIIRSSSAAKKALDNRQSSVIQPCMHRICIA